MFHPMTWTLYGLVEEPSPLNKQKQWRHGPSTPGGLTIMSSSPLKVPRIVTVSAMDAFVIYSGFRDGELGVDWAPRGEG